MTDLLLPRGSLRRFREQIGERYSNLYDYQFKDSDRVVIVGDYSCDRYWDYEEKGIYPVPMLMIFDGQTKRNEYSDVYNRVLKTHLPYIEVMNPAGTITSKAYECIDYCFKNNIRALKVDGEEDLLTLAVIAQIDIMNVCHDYYVVFGIPDEGVEIVRVNPEVQYHVIDILNSMRRSDYTEHGNKIAVAGTFTYIHDGHRALLRKAIELCEDDKILSLGLTTNDFMYKTRLGGVDYQLRVIELRKFFESEGFDRYSIRPIHQSEVSFGKSDIRTLVCSTETIDNAYKLNRFQTQCTTNGIPDPPLEIVEVPLVLNDKGEKISASKILGYRKMKEVKE